MNNDFVAETMKLLPREHGATMIWLSATICAIATLPSAPHPLRLLIFIAASIATLIMLGIVTGSSKTIMRAERNRTILPFASGLLSLIIPFGHFVMIGEVTVEVVAVTLLFLSYTAIGIVYIQEAVRAFRNHRRPALVRYVVAGSIIYFIMVISVEYLGWLSILSILAFLPLYALWIWMRMWEPPTNLPKVKIVKKIGLRQTANMLAFTIILSLSSWL